MRTIGQEIRHHINQAYLRGVFMGMCYTVSIFSVIVILLSFVGGCYVGKATFSGEEMQMYPIFGFSADTVSAGE